MMETHRLHILTDNAYTVDHLFEIDHHLSNVGHFASGILNFVLLLFYLKIIFSHFIWFILIHIFLSNSDYSLFHVSHAFLGFVTCD